jgi:hypothetical protein
VIQELAMGGKGVLLRCGDRTIDFKTFTDGLGTIHLYLWASKTVALNNEWRILSGEADNYWNFQPFHRVWKDLLPMNQAEEEGKNRLNISQLLEVSGQSETSDKRDHVYGLVGLMEPSLATKIQLDYTLDTRSVFTSVAKSAIEASNNLDILRFWNPWGGQGAPSWVPDWALYRVREFSWRNQFSASEGLNMDVQFREWGGLRCKGIIVDQITGFMKHGENYNSHTRIPTQVESAYGDDEATRIALYRNLTAAAQYPNNPENEAIFHIPTTYSSGLPQWQEKGWSDFIKNREFYFRFAQWFDFNKNFPLGHRTLEAYFDSRLPDTSREEFHLELWNSIISAIQNRIFTVTSKGYFGWAPKHVSQGYSVNQQERDFYCIVFGCSMPIILRERNGYYQVIGEGYVQGFADGEAASLLASGKYEVVDLNIY